MSPRLRQVVTVCGDLVGEVERARTLFASGPGDVDAGMAEFGLAHEVLQVGAGTYIEICAPLDPDADTAATRFLGRGGDGGYMAVIEVDDATAFRARLNDAGLAMPVAREYHGNELTQVHPKEFGTLLEVDEIRSGHDWHYPAIENEIDTTVTSGIVAIDIAVDDPAAMARVWADAFAVATSPVGDGPPMLAFDGGVVRFVPLTSERGGVVAFDVVATDRGRVGETHHISGVTIRFV